MKVLRNLLYVAFMIMIMLMMMLKKDIIMTSPENLDTLHIEIL